MARGRWDRGHKTCLREAAVNFRGIYQDGETYTAGDAVMKDGNLWRAIATISKQGSPFVSTTA
jgi:hypothetical protein